MTQECDYSRILYTHLITESACNGIKNGFMIGKTFAHV